MTDLKPASAPNSGVAIGMGQLVSVKGFTGTFR